MHKISSALTIPFLTTFSWINLLFCKTLRNIWQKYVSAIGVAQGQRCRKQFFLNGPTPASFSFTFGLFKQTLQIFTTNICEKCPSRIRCCDSNPQPLECESPPITLDHGFYRKQMLIWLFWPIIITVFWRVYRAFFNWIHN